MRQDKSWSPQVQKNKLTDTKIYETVKEAKAWMEIISEGNENDLIKNDKLRVGETAKLVIKSTLPGSFLTFF